MTDTIRTVGLFPEMKDQFEKEYGSYETARKQMRDQKMIDDLESGKVVTHNKWRFWISNGVIIRDGIKSSMEEFKNTCDIDL